MSILEFIPIAILIFITAISIGILIILSIHGKKSVLSEDDNDIIDHIINKKKRQLNANIGGMSWSTYITIMIIAPLLLGGISFLFLPYKPLCLIFAMIGLIVPDAIIKLSADKSKKHFDEKYAKALKALASSLRCGRSIEQAVADVSSNPFIDSHIQAGFKQIASDIQVGIPINKAFENFANDTNNNYAKDVAAAISMQAQVGGNEAKVITTVIQNINERIMVRKEVKTLFADTTMLVYAMDFLPWIIMICLFFMSPQFIEPYFSSFGMTMLLIGIMIFTFIGSIVIHKLAKSAKGE